MRTADIQVFQSSVKTVFYRRKRLKRIRFPRRIKRIIKNYHGREFQQNMLPVKSKFSEYFQTDTETEERDSV